MEIFFCFCWWGTVLSGIDRREKRLDGGRSAVLSFI